MIPPLRMQDAYDYVEWLRQQVDGLDVPADYQSRAAITCFGLTQDHHQAVAVLMRHQLYGSALALVRVAFEAYVRGAWFANCSSVEFAKKYFNGAKVPKMPTLIADLECSPSFKNGVLSRIKKAAWDSMCDFTHSGGVHAQRWNQEHCVAAKYSDEELLDALTFCEVLASLAAMGVAQLASNESLGIRVYEMLTRRQS